MEYNSNTRSSRYVSGPQERRMTEAQARNMVRNSTTGSRTRNKPRVVKVYADRAKKAIIALCLTCIVAASGITVATINGVNEFRENAVIAGYSREYRSEAIGHNTHRTWDNQHYYYDHADVHNDGIDYLQQDGVLSASGHLNEETAEDLSVYFAYRNFGEAQMKKFFNENGYSCSTLEEYVKQEGFETIDEWAEKQGDKVLLLDKAKNEGMELQQMLDDVDKIEDVAKNELGDALGGK